MGQRRLVGQSRKGPESNSVLLKIVPQGSEWVLHDSEGEGKCHSVIQKEFLPLFLRVECLSSNELGETPVSLLLSEPVVSL